MTSPNSVLTRTDNHIIAKLHKMRNISIRTQPMGANSPELPQLIFKGTITTIASLDIAHWTVKINREIGQTKIIVDNHNPMLKDPNLICLK